MTSARLRKLAAVAAMAVGIVFASNTVHADAATAKKQVKTPAVHSVQVAHPPAPGNTFSDWWV